MEMFTDDEDEAGSHMEPPRSPMSVTETTTEPGTRQHKVRKHAHAEESHKAPVCWLCEYQGNRTTNEVIRFILDGIPHMSLDALIVQSKFLLDNVERDSNCTLLQLRTHVMQHMLHPRIKIALQIQEMSRMQQEIAKCCVVSDLDTGEKTVNPAAMRSYLTLCSQVASLYKTGEDKLIFNNSSMDK